MSGNWTKYEESDKISGVGPNVIGLCKNVPSRSKGRNKAFTRPTE